MAQGNGQSAAFEVVADGHVTTPRGFQAGGLHCGLKKTTRHDLGAIICEVPASAAGVYTTNVFQAAPIRVTKDSIGEEIYALAAEIFPICRSITGNGVRETLQRISAHIPLDIHEVPTGTKFFDWIVPREWNIRDA